MARTGKPMTMDRQGGDALNMKAAAAGHQADCSCHAADAGCCPGFPYGAALVNGALWHFDPRCGARPEAVARMKAGA